MTIILESHHCAIDFRDVREVHEVHNIVSCSDLAFGSPKRCFAICLPTAFYRCRAGVPSPTCYVVRTSPCTARLRIKRLSYYVWSNTV